MEKLLNYHLMSPGNAIACASAIGLTFTGVSDPMNIATAANKCFLIAGAVRQGSLLTEPKKTRENLFLIGAHAEVIGENRIIRDLHHSQTSHPFKERGAIEMSFAEFISSR